METLSILVWLHRLATLDVGPGELLTLVSWAWWMVGIAGVVLCLAGWLLPALLDLAGGRLSTVAARVVGVVALAVAILLLGMDIAKHGADAQHKAEMARLRDEAQRERDRVAGEAADAISRARAAAAEAAAADTSAKDALRAGLDRMQPDAPPGDANAYGGGLSPAATRTLTTIIGR